MLHFLDLLKRFRRDERGVFLVLFGVLAIVLIATSGAVVDFSRIQQARSKAQVALDAAALGLQSTISNAGVTEETLRNAAQLLLNERIADASVTAVVDTASTDIGAGRLTLNAHIIVPTYFVQLVGVPSVRASLLSEVQRASSDLEIALSIDITGSMAPTYNWRGQKTSDKIGDLINASNTLIDLLISDTQVPTYSRMAIVPWSASVNVGTYANNIRGTVNTTSRNITGATWLTGTAKNISSISRGNTTTINSTAHGFVVGDTITFANVGALARSGSSCINTQSFVISSRTANAFTIPLNTNSCSNATNNTGTATKCARAECTVEITSNSHGRNNGNAVWITDIGGATGLNNAGYIVSNRTANTLVLEGSYGPSAGGTYSSNTGRLFCGDHGCPGRAFYAVAGNVQSFPVSTCVSERPTNSYNDTAPSTTRLNMVYGPTNQCPAAVIQPLTSNKTTLHNIIGTYEANPRALTADGSTAGHLGLAWGWYMIAPDFGYLWPNTENRPAHYGKTNLIKAIVFMTDGVFNTAYNTGVIAGNSLSGSGSDNNKINQNATVGLSKAQAESLCAEIKKPEYGTLLYVVGFDLASDATTLNFLRDCATSVDHFYRADTGADLTAAFRSIAQNLSELRISK